jgi:hypothetical protein
MVGENIVKRVYVKGGCSRGKRGKELREGGYRNRKENNERDRCFAKCCSLRREGIRLKFCDGEGGAGECNNNRERPGRIFYF